MHIDELFSAGLPPIRTVGEPGAHGAGSTGMQAPGVKTPSAAAVCAAVIGLAKLMHTPNGAMFTNGMLSMIVAAGLFSMLTMARGRTLNVLGAAPIGQASIAPVTTGKPIGASYRD